MDWLIPDWPAPSNVQACVTTTSGGVSVAPYAGFNLAAHVGDDPAAVEANRRVLREQLGCEPGWLSQVHGTCVVEANPAQVPEADAAWSATPGVAAAVLTADCLPVLFCDRAGTRVAAAHAGWRGLAGGVLEATLDKLDCPGDQVLAWLGPCIGPEMFEVGLEVRDAFLRDHAEAATAFRPGAKPDKLMGDLYALARIRLAARGVTAVYGGGFCTVSDTRFYSYRRANPTGRFASLVWLRQDG